METELHQSSSSLGCPPAHLPALSYYGMATMWHDALEALKVDLDQAQKKVSKYKTWHKVATNHFTGVPRKEQKIEQAAEKVIAWQEKVDDLLLEIKQLQEVRTRCELAANSLYPDRLRISHFGHFLCIAQ